MTQKCYICLSNKGDILKLSCCDRSFVHEKCIQRNMRLKTNKCPECKQEIQYSTVVVRKCKCWKLLYSILWRVIFITSLISSLIMMVSFYRIGTEYKRLNMYDDIQVSLGLGAIVRIAAYIPIIFAASLKKYLNRGVVFALCLIVSDITYFTLYQKGKLKTDHNICWNYIYVILAVVGVNLLLLIGSNINPCIRGIKDSMISCLLGIKRGFYNCLRFSFCYETKEVHTNHVKLESV